jgi:signal transduction histidine kinase
MRLTEGLGAVQEPPAGVPRNQARVQHLLDAFLSVATGLDLETALHRLVDVAAELVDARSGALGLPAPDGSAAAVVRAGAEDDPVDSPAHDPEARPSLAVPVLVRGQAFGELVVTGKRRGAFTAEDEAVLTALAGAAGIAIDNARLYEEAEVRRRWTTAVSDVRACLLSASSPDDALALIAARVAELTGADAAWLLTGPDPADGCHVVRAGAGEGGTDGVDDRLRADEHPVLAAVLAAGSVVRLEGVAEPAGGPCIGVRLPGDTGQDVVLVAWRRAGAPAFEAHLTPLLASFADQIAAALDMAARQRLARRLDVYADRDRIAQDLHDNVIQRVFAAGLTLQSVLPHVGEAEAQRRIRQVVHQLDETVRDIRTTIFDLHATDSGTSASLRRRVLDVVTETAGRTLHPTVRMSGAIDSLVTGQLAADVEAVTREAVSNAARHSGAGHVTVTVDVGDEVVLEVVDDGRGIEPHAARSGLRNLEARARDHGGGLGVDALPDGGTRLRWWAPVR